MLLELYPNLKMSYPSIPIRLNVLYKRAGHISELVKVLSTLPLTINYIRTFEIKQLILQSIDSKNIFSLTIFIIL